MFRLIMKTVQRFPAFIVSFAVLLTFFTFTYGADVSSHLQAGGFLTLGAESTKVNETIRKDFGKLDAGLMVLVEAKEAQKITDPIIKNEIQNQVDFLETRHGVRDVRDYITTNDQSLVSKDQTKTILLVTMTGNEDQQAKDVGSFRDEIKSDVVSLRIGGAAGLNNEITEQINNDLVRAEAISLAALAVLLLVAFRGVIAAALSLILGGFTILSAFAVMKWLAGHMPIVEYAQNIIILLGLGLAVDYSLLIVSRFREELYNFHNDTQAALQRTYKTAGHTVFFSGITVAISLGSLIIFPLDFLRSMGIGGIAAVIIALIAALIVLPGILRLLGPCINWLSFGSVNKINKAIASGVKIKEKQSLWRKSGALFMKRPIITIILGFAFLTAMILPGLKATFASPDEQVMPPSAQGRQVLEILESDFNIKSQKVTVLYEANQLANPEQIGNLYDYVQELEKKTNMSNIDSFVTLSPGLTKQDYQIFMDNPQLMPEALKQARDTYIKGDRTVITIPYNYAATSKEAHQLAKDVGQIQSPYAATWVGGQVAELLDQLDALQKYGPYALAGIMIVLFVLLCIMLRSILVPLQATILNLMSMGAAFGGMVLIFGDSFVSEWLNLSNAGVIYASIPPMIFAIAFGLSMDYSVFLYSRIKEEYDEKMDNHDAILEGLQKTGNIITAAALLLIVVVLAFANSGIVIMQQIGVGLALAILIDAFIIRMILVPASMQLFGKANWWTPSFTKRRHKHIFKQ